MGDGGAAVKVLVMGGTRTNHDQLREVLGAGEFDVVQDTSGCALADVPPLVEVFRGRIGHYLFASSTVIYARVPLSMVLGPNNIAADRC